MSESGALLRRGGFELWVALRYLRSTRGDAFILLLSRITAIGLTLGVAALVLALAALSGFQERLLADLLAHTPALSVELPPEADTGAIAERVVAVGGVGSIQLSVSGRGWLRQGEDVQPVEILGFEERLPAWLPGSRFPAGPAKLDPAAPELWVSAPLAHRWLLSVGDVVELISPRLTLSPLGRQPRSSRMRIAGLHFPGEADERFAERVAVPLQTAQALLDAKATTIDIELAGGHSPEAVARALEGALGDIAGIRVLTWRDHHRALRFVLRLEKTVIFLAMALIVLVASFALVAALSLILAAKRQDVAILAAMGAGQQSLRRVFLLLGSLLAASGTLGGAALGVLVSVTLDRFGLLPLPGEVYLVDHVPFAVRFDDVAVVVSATFALTLTAAAIASRKTDSLPIIEALRS